MFLAALLLAGVLYRCSSPAEAGNAVTFELDSVQSFTAHFRVSMPANLVGALVRKPVGKSYLADTTMLSGNPRVPIGLYFPNTDWEFTLLTKQAKGGSWAPAGNLPVGNRFSSKKFDKFNLWGLGDSVTIGTIDILPYRTLLNYTSFGCQSFSSGWETLSPVAETVNRFLSVQSGRFYHGVVDLPGGQPQVVFLFKVTDTQVLLVELDSSTCLFDFSRLDASATPLSWNARGVTVTAEHFDLGRQLHITLPEGATLQVRACTGCLD